MSNKDPPTKPFYKLTDSSVQIKTLRKRFMVNFAIENDRYLEKTFSMYQCFTERERNNRSQASYFYLRKCKGS